MLFKVDQDAAVHAALAQGEIIQAKHARCCWRYGSLTNQPEQGIATGGQAEFVGSSGARSPAQGKAENAQRAGQAYGSLRTNGKQLWQALSKGSLRTGWDVTKEAPQVQK